MSDSKYVLLKLVDSVKSAAELLEIHYLISHLIIGLKTVLNVFGFKEILSQGNLENEAKK